MTQNNKKSDAQNQSEQQQPGEQTAPLRQAQDEQSSDKVTVEVTMNDGSVRRVEGVDATTVSAVEMGSLLHDSTSKVDDLKEGGKLDRSQTLKVTGKDGDLELLAKDIKTITVSEQEGSILWSVESRARTVDAKSE